MKVIFVKFIFIVIILVNLPVFSYSQVLNLPKLKSYKRVKIGLNNYKRMEGKSLVILSDSIRFNDILTQKQQALDFEEINYLRVQTGTQTATWALYGGLFMAASSLIAVADVASDPNMGFKDNTATIIAGFVAGGAVIGALIGSTIPKWKTYYIHNKVGYCMPLNFDLYAWDKHVGLSVKLKF